MSVRGKIIAGLPNLIFFMQFRGPLKIQVSDKAT
jgi:hypothetical protein